ncbi:hypothetical protein N9J18_02235, partial [Porticoccaceae bacterium]|nr:hypothetical protein [Porticoccaceae bacterium]
GVNLVLTTDGAAVRLTGPWWSWDPNGGPEASDNGDGTWTVTLDPAPTDNMEYLWVVDGVQENLVDNAANAECTAEIDGGALITDYANYANRVHVVDSGDAADTYDACAGTSSTDPEPEPEPTPADGFQITEAFGGTTIGEGSVYTYPSGTEVWAGFANTNTSLYPMTIAEDSVITFTGSVPAGGDADVRFRFEKNPHPDVEPSFNTEAVTVSGADAATYTIAVAAQGANTFSSFLLYLNTQDVGVVVSDIAISAAPAGPVDSDNDGVNDDEDAFPNDASETADSDNDGTGDNADAFPNDASETADSDNDGVGDNADFAPNDPAVQEGPKQSVFVSGSPKGMVGSPVSVTVGYDVSDDDASLTGLGLRVHYDSSVLTFVEFADVLSTDNISSGQPANDTDNEDGDASTDKYITANWASLFGNWPGSLPADLLTATFNVADDDSLVNTVINFSAASNAAGYQFDATPYTMDILSGSFDFDGNGTADALTDGLMLLRYAFGLSGSAVTDGAIAGDSPMSSEEVLAALETASGSFADIDGNGVVDALTDGLMLLRSLFGLTGDAVISGAVGNGATRTTAADIEAYIDSMTP